MRQLNILGGQELRQQRITVFLLKRNTELPTITKPMRLTWRSQLFGRATAEVCVLNRTQSSTFLKSLFGRVVLFPFLGVTACLCLRRCVGANGISKQPLRLLRFLSLFGSVLRPPRFRRLRNLGSTCRRHRPLAIHFVATDDRCARWSVMGRTVQSCDGSLDAF